MSDQNIPAAPRAVQSRPRRRFRRQSLEQIAMALMALGAIMMFQPFVKELYTYSFVVFLAGTVMFTIVSHFSD